MKSIDKTPQPKFRRDYCDPTFWIDEVRLEFDLGEDETVVRAALAVHQSEDHEDASPFVLDGESLDLRRVAIDGTELPADRFVVDDTSLTVRDVPNRFTLETTVAIKPQDNTQLMGLYKVDGLFCTQCEAEGFRRITYFLDRPDVMARYRVKINADKERYPVLLSNGNRLATGDGDDGQHWVEWEDPFPKPAYLFALVGGDLKCHDGTHRTMSGRDIRLEIWVEAQNIDKCEHALASLRKSMHWDEETFGLEYDLDLYMIVATNDFNMGAMENKGLNIFNSKFVLARPDTATDDNYEQIEGVIAHEYFHNWTGNRVTCRDWFQLTLKEGLTVFRDQQFSMDVQSAAVKRIQDVKTLRMHQFPEDAGPMAHPIRPESYIEMNNFYTATVYEKGAEVVRMYQTLLGREGFRKGMNLYFERHDGQAVTCDDFRAAMADANGADLDKFEQWYLQAGTPTIKADGHWDEAAAEYRLTLQQSFPAIADSEQRPALLPVALALLAPDGQELQAPHVLQLRDAEQSFTISNVTTRPVASLLRNFSAPAHLDFERSRDELAFLLAHDTDPFNRWDAGQTLAASLLLDLANKHRAGQDLVLDPLLPEALRRVLLDETLDGSFKQLALELPEERILVQSQGTWDVDAVHAAREFARREIANLLRDDLLSVYESARVHEPYAFERSQIDARRLARATLGYLAALAEPDTNTLLIQQFDSADNMTNQWAALELLTDIDCPERQQAIDAFYERWKDEPLVVDKWFTVQALSTLPGAATRVRELTTHPDFTLDNPNRARSLLGAFAILNQVRFHEADGTGYTLVADQLLDLDSINPQVASRLVSAFNHWKKLDSGRQDLMRAQLERVAAKPNLSKDVYEIVGRALGRV